MKTLSSYRLACVTLIVVAASTGCSRPRPTQPVIAEVGDTYIAESEFLDGYRRRLLETGVQDSEQARRSFLDGMVNKRLLTLYALQTGLYDREGEEVALARIRDKLLLDAYTAGVVYAQIQITDDDLRQMFVRMNTSITARHLYSRSVEGALALKARLDTGETFEDLAREVFADPVLADNGGSVGTFSFDEMDAAFEDAAFELEIGAVSGPVRTARGYSIIQVQDRFTNPILTEAEFNGRRDRITRFVRYRKRMAARAEHVRSTAMTLDIGYHEPAFTRLVAQITGVRLDLDAEASDLGAEQLVSYGPVDNRRSWTIAKFRERAELTSPEQRAAVEDGPTLRMFIEGLLVRDKTVSEATNQGFGDTAAFENAFALAREDWIYESFRDSFREAITVPRDSVQSYYDKFGDEFVIPEKVRVWEILLTTKRDAAAVLDSAQSRPFELLAAEHSVREGARAVGGDLGFVARGQLGTLADDVFSASEGELLGPIEISGRYAILKIGGRVPSRAADLHDVYEEVESRIRRFMERHLLVDEITRLKETLPVEIDWSVLYSAPVSS